jgi:hypothetical protein
MSPAACTYLDNLGNLYTLGGGQASMFVGCCRKELFAYGSPSDIMASDSLILSQRLPTWF